MREVRFPLLLLGVYYAIARRQEYLLSYRSTDTAPAGRQQTPLGLSARQFWSLEKGAVLTYCTQKGYVKAMGGGQTNSDSDDGEEEEEEDHY